MNYVQIIDSVTVCIVKPSEISSANCVYNRGLNKFCDHSAVWPKVSLVLEDFKFQKARTKIEVFLSLPCWLSQLN